MTSATFRLRNTAVLSISAVEAPLVLTSAEIDDRLAPTYRRTRLRPGLLQKLAGVHERRWWPTDVSFADAAAMAGAKALAEAGVHADQVGILINTSVSRSHLEPSTAVAIHHQLGLRPHAISFDVVNACLGFLTAIHLAGTMIDSGQLQYALIVAGEGSRQTQERTLERLAGDDATAADIREHFATLTLGSGAAAIVLGPADDRPEGHRVVGGVTKAATEHHDLCVGDLQQMRTDIRALSKAGVALAVGLWEDAKPEFSWADASRFVAHQTSVAHVREVARGIGVDRDRFPLSLPSFGNMGPVSVPFTLAREADALHSGDQVVLLGIGSGLNASFVELTW
ncbi:3-oxoacyl-[acyl-carrier-protein] synthase-3 [Friedmanniella endophytica]|uniref:3-oxoacyl-[acyl-carrier-protein] synthase-3 n=1 Tax=Microlunatus kandeliicorticis TaxID=1759536 RepID=A0A7W3P6J7_9ACTN|nr:3-oxoacyl-ACP synthase III [Microlunatus kandeliicorticis]MBA8795027.1 3-oxoacyl-[acyl-carrier-protein] synthase-3 [Microlunatus kandeliicorticis]